MSKEIEEWRDIKGYEGLYQVSDWGRVRKLCRTRPSKVRKQDTTHDGYKRIGLWKNGICKHYGVHRLVAEAFLPNPENKPCVGHLKTMENGLEDTTANEPWNIAWMTYAENRNYGTCNERIRNAQKGRVFTEEHRKNLSEALKKSERFQNIVKSIEYKSKLSQIHKGKMLNRKDLSVQVDQISQIDGEVIASFPSAKEAARQTGFAQSNISRCCNGGFSYKGTWVNVTQAYGFIWRKVDSNQLESELP